MRFEHFLRIISTDPWGKGEPSPFHNYCWESIKANQGWAGNIRILFPGCMYLSARKIHMSLVIPSLWSLFIEVFRYYYHGGCLCYFQSNEYYSGPCRKPSMLQITMISTALQIFDQSWLEWPISEQEIKVFYILYSKEFSVHKTGPQHRLPALCTVQ